MTASKEKLGELHELLAKTYLHMIQGGTAKAADLNAARQFLRDNGIQVSSGDAGTVGKLASAMHAVPFPSKEELAEEAM